MAGVFLYEHATLYSLIEDLLDDTREQIYLGRNCFDRIYKAVHIPHRICQVNDALVYRNLSHDDLIIKLVMIQEAWNANK